MRPKVGFFDFTCCEGCQIELTNFGDSVFLELLKHIDIVEFREAMSEKAGALDIACIEGSFSREADRERLERIRERSKIVIAYGACAATGGINGLKNHQTDYAKCVYGDHANDPHLKSSFARPISDAIKVDFNVHGCPMDKYEFVDIVTHLLHGKTPVIPNYPVCVECKRRETVCRVEAFGEECMGMMARAGCNAPCPADGIPCEACRGFVDTPNEPAFEKMMLRLGYSKERAATKSKMFTANCRSDSDAYTNRQRGAK